MGRQHSGRQPPLDLETVFLRAAQAEFWINPSHYRSLDALTGADPQRPEFAATRTGQVYNNTAQTNVRSGNPIWETGTVRPDLILADLLQIFHPQLLDHPPTGILRAAQIKLGCAF